MTDWEKCVNLALHDLNEAQSTRRIDPLEYRRRRRRLLLSAMQFSSSTCTLRRVAANPTYLLEPRSRARPPSPKRTGAVPSALRSWKLRLWCACMLLGTALVCWHVASSG